MSALRLLTAAVLLMPAATAAQPVPADLTAMPPVPTDHAPARTEWGDPDLRAVYTLDRIAAGRIALSRPEQLGDRFWLTDEEFAARLEAARRSDAAFSEESSRGTQGLEAWMLAEPFARRSSMLVGPADGKLPPLTPEAEALRAAGRTSWFTEGRTYDWIDDFDTWDRCITRGFPASMLPFRYNNGVRIFQAPGFVVIHFEMLGDRIIPLARSEHRPAAVESWMGSSLGHWEGDTLVVETTRIKTGDGATRDVWRRAASPLNVATGVQSNNAIPVSEQARAVERFTRTGDNSLVYELSYSDPPVFTAPWTARVTWTRDESYQMFEYACHEGNVSLRNHINASRAERRGAAAGLP
ncbi:MAG TPA: hypothetical protein VI168_04245 [Croceibacterium sp.]